MTINRILLFCGIALLAAGVTGAGTTYNSMRRENYLHARVGTIQVRGPGGRGGADVPVMREGEFRLFVSVGEECPGRSPDWRGSLRIVLISGAVRFDTTLRSPLNAGGGMTLLTSFTAAGTGTPPWRLEADWESGAAADPCLELFVLPPQPLEIGGYLESGIARMLLFGGMMMSGFVLIVLFGRKR